VAPYLRPVPCRRSSRRTVRKDRVDAMRLEDHNAPLDLGRLAQTCRRFWLLIQSLPLWKGLVSQLSEAFPEPMATNMHPMATKIQLIKCMRQVPAEWSDPRYDFTAIGDSTSTCVFAPSPTWQGLAPFSQYNLLNNYRRKLYSRFDDQIQQAANELEEDFHANFMFDHAPDWMVADAVFHSIDNLIRTDWRAFGFTGCDARNLVVGGWQSVEWDDPAVQDDLHEAVHDYITERLSEIWREMFLFRQLWLSLNGYEDEEEEEQDSDDDAMD
jgi:hypothetical protein